MTITEKIQSYESEFSANKYDGESTAPFVIEPGTIPILISAPHAVNHFREGKVKWADTYTGGIAKYLHETTRCHLMYNASYSESDPNYDPFRESPYQQALVEYVKENEIRLVIDLHGAALSRPFDIEIGTADDNTKLVNDAAFVLTNYLESNAIIVTRHLYKWNTVTKGIYENTGIETIQFEINKKYRSPDHQSAATSIPLEMIVKALSEFVWKEEKRIQEKD